MVWSLFQAHDWGQKVRTDARFQPSVHLLLIPFLWLQYLAALAGTARMVADRKFLLMVHRLGISPCLVPPVWLFDSFLKSVPLALVASCFGLGVYVAEMTWGAVLGAAGFVVLASVWTATWAILTLLAARTFPRWLAGGLLASICLAIAWEARNSRAFSSNHALELLAYINSFSLSRIGGAGRLAAAVDGGEQLTSLAGVGLQLSAMICSMLVLITWGWDRVLKPEGGSPGPADRLLGPVRAVLKRARWKWAAQSSLELLVWMRRVHIVPLLCLLGFFAVLACTAARQGDEELPVTLLPFLACVCGVCVGSDGTHEILHRQTPFRFHRACGTDPADYGTALVVTAAVASALVTLSASLLIIRQPTLFAGIRQIGSALILAATEGAWSAMLSITLYPLLPRLGLIGKIKAGILQILVAGLVLLLAGSNLVLPGVMVIVALMLRRKRLGDLIQRRIWDAALV